MKEVLPRAKELEEKKPGLMVELVKKAGELGLLGGGRAGRIWRGRARQDFDHGADGEDFGLCRVCGDARRAGGNWHAADRLLRNEEQKKKYLPKIASGEWLAAYCLSEPQAGSDAQNALTRAELSPDGQHWIMNGQKMWITNGGFADVYIVFAKVNGEKFSAFIVERKVPGFTAGNEERKMGIHGSSTTPIFMENCKIPKENLLHEIGRGHIVAFNILNAGRFTLGASCVGGRETNSGHLIAVHEGAKAFGKQIGEFGLMKEKLAEMAIRIFAVESMVYRSAGTMEAAMAVAEGSGDKVQQTMKVLEEYAIEARSQRCTAARCWITWWTKACRFLAATASMKIIR